MIETPLSQPPGARLESLRIVVEVVTVLLLGGLALGTLRLRDAELRLVVFPRPESYSGPVAVLADELSCSGVELPAGCFTPPDDVKKLLDRARQKGDEGAH